MKTLLINPILALQEKSILWQNAAVRTAWMQQISGKSAKNATGYLRRLHASTTQLHFDWKIIENESCCFAYR